MGPRIPSARALNARAAASPTAGDLPGSIGSSRVKIWSGSVPADHAQPDRGNTLRLSVLSSGSSGNATYMETDSGGLLVDAGLPPRRIGALLGRIGRNLADVNAVLLTHGHADHTCGVAALVRERKIEVYAAPGVGESLGTNTVASGEPCSVEDLEVMFFEVPHDSMTYGVRLSD